MSISSCNSLSLRIYEGSYADGLIETIIHMTKRVGMVSRCDGLVDPASRLGRSCSVI